MEEPAVGFVIFYHTRQHARNCEDRCLDLWCWTGRSPPSLPANPYGGGGYDLSDSGADQYDATRAGNFGRAATLYPRTLEILDQLDLLDEMNQIGSIGRNSVTWKDGKRVTGRGWHSTFYEMGETYLNYLLNIR